MKSARRVTLNAAGFLSYLIAAFAIIVSVPQLEEVLTRRAATAVLPVANRARRGKTLASPCA